MRVQCTFRLPRGARREENHGDAIWVFPRVVQRHRMALLPRRLLEERPEISSTPTGSSITTRCRSSDSPEAISCNAAAWPNPAHSSVVTQTLTPSRWQHPLQLSRTDGGQIGASTASSRVAGAATPASVTNSAAGRPPPFPAVTQLVQRAREPLDMTGQFGVADQWGVPISSAGLDRRRVRSVVSPSM